MKYAARTDDNQVEIVRVFRTMGCSVTDLSRVGKGCPDLLVGHWGVTIPVELKTAKGEMTGDQKKWADAWRGSFVVVRSGEDAIDLVRLIRAGEYDVNQQRRKRRT